MGTEIAELWRYPVKALVGERVATLDLDERGVVGDRRWAIHDEDGRIASGKSTRRFRRRDEALTLAGRTGDSGVEVLDPLRSPGGPVRRAGDPSTDVWLSERLGVAVRLREEGEVPHLDAGPVHLVGTATLAWAAEHWGGSPDARRLRPNLVVATDEPFVEDTWDRLDVGTAVLGVEGPTERCRMLDLVEGRPALHPWLRGAARERDACLGVYASVLDRGRLAQGDAVTVRA
ncbi:MOSC domain-containing protein [Nocardioides sp. TRM66260-LWL]|uniref:MOSC domain-containing protein n=1 Tax=Nocardioides sp. TRM66260-LWL TaxID=2874478 RepID=UPI001CC812B9|nr:MOSC N-terminal beta barrel domain-containing protein [Nocardioides sp. TRM66260-LWL]MBZ5734000.1 MOSC domain-containing protein [Nocardioides sp. TRM66260-LWL]